MPTTTVNGAELHYRDAGAGDDVVLLLHAFPLNSRMWSHQVEALAKKHRVIAPDLRGFGKSPPSREPVTLELLARDVRALLAELGIERAVVAGLSMGGYLAFELHRQARPLFGGLALCDTRAGADTEEGRRAREKLADTSLEKGLAWVAEDASPKLLKVEPDPRVLAEVRAMIMESSIEGVAAAQRAMAKRPDSTDTLREISCPVLVVVGAEDVLTPPAESEKMAAIARGSRVVTIPNAGHIACMENPEAFTAALAELVDAQGGGRNP